MHLLRLKQKSRPLPLGIVLLVGYFLIIGFSGIVQAQSIPTGCPGGPSGSKPPGVVCPAPPGCSDTPNDCIQTGLPAQTKYSCGSGGDAVQTSIDFGCSHKGNGIIDLTFAIIRFLSLGVGIVVIGSIVVAGIQFTTSRGDPQASAKAIGRLRSSMIALLLYIFLYAILNYVIPVGFFKL